MAITVDYGTDISCTDDMDPLAREVSGQEVVAQAIYRRLTTPRGRLIDDPDYGTDVRSFLHRGLTTAELRAVEAAIRSEVLKDERIALVTVKATSADDGQSMTVVLNVTTGLGPFRLVFAVTAETVSLLKEGA